MLRTWCLARGVLVILGVALSADWAGADLEPGLRKPYQLEVVLHFADHRFLTPAFQEEVQRQLGDLLRLTFGDLAEVRVQNSHLLLKAVVAKGLGPALDGWTKLSDVQTHFLLIDYEAGRYRLRARQHDGLTGLVSPLVRQEQTGDRRQVPRLAARLVDRDFGLVGTVTGQDGQNVEVTFRGGSLGVSLGHWLKLGDVLAVSRVSHEGGKERATRLEWALLQVATAPDGGVCRCRYFHRYRDDRLQEGPGTEGYRCLRLATTTAPLRLRLIDERTFAPLASLQVHVSHTGFGEASLELSTGPDGLAITPEAFTGVAFVQVLIGKQVRVRIPVEIIADRPVVCRITISEEAFNRDRVELRKEHWLRRLYEELQLANDRVVQLNALLQKAPEDTLKRARAGLAGLSQGYEALFREQSELQQAATGLPGPPLDLTEGVQRLHELRELRDQLQAFAARLENVIKQSNSPEAKALHTMLEHAALLEHQADFEEAIELYEKILKKDPDQPNVRDRLKKLQADWRTHGSEHEKARGFIYGAWLKKMDTAALKVALADAWKAFHECQKVGDKLSLQKMLPADLAHVGRLKERLEVLRRTPDREDARSETATIAALAEELRRLHGQVSAYVRNK